MAKVTKYRAKKTVLDGITFASKAEATRYRNLKLLERAGEIQNLELQPSYVLEHNGTKICTYRADFKYMQDGKEVIEDVKGFKTPVYRLKKKLMLAIHGIDILETS